MGRGEHEAWNFGRNVPSASKGKKLTKEQERLTKEVTGEAGEMDVLELKGGKCFRKGCTEVSAKEV